MIGIKYCDKRELGLSQDEKMFFFFNVLSLIILCFVSITIHFSSSETFLQEDDIIL